MKLNKEFYEDLCSTLESCVQMVSYRELRKCRNMIVIGTNVKNKFSRFYEYLLNENPTINLFFVCQKQMIEYMTGLVGTNNNFFEWNGKYSLETLNMLKDKINLNEIDSFLYFSTEPLNLKDINIIQIANELEKQNNIRVYCVDNAKELYLCKKLDLCNIGLILYEQINSYIEIKLKQNK